nr:SIP domain-containing protein [Nonomuraea fuscirosea]
MPHGSAADGTATRGRRPAYPATAWRSSTRASASTRRPGRGGSSSRPARAACPPSPASWPPCPPTPAGTRWPRSPPRRTGSRSTTLRGSSGWIVRDDPGAVPGTVALTAALTAALALPMPEEPCCGWVVGESELPVRLRRHRVRAGVPKEHIMFCGYWRHH